jgi:hypothetical protein
LFKRFCTARPHGSVGTEEAEELAGRDGEVDVLDGGEVAEAASEACV